jgi:hypothetical protein
MPSSHIFRERLLDLSYHLGLPELIPNEFNVCSLALNDEHWIHISSSAEDMQIHWTSAMTSVALMDARPLFSTLLAVNLDWELTQGGFFAFDEATEVVFFRFHEPVTNLDAQRFLAVTDRFIERSSFWKGRLRRATDRLADKCSEPFNRTATAHESPFHYPLSHTLRSTF